ncbi:unnamed protein product, partial [Brassica rapa]
LCFIVFVPLPFLAGQFLWFSGTVHVEPYLYRLVIRLGCVSGFPWFEHVIPALEPVARAFCVSRGCVLPVIVVAPECYVWSGCFFSTRFVHVCLVFVASLLSPFCNNARLLLYEWVYSGDALCPWWLQLRTSFASCS